MTIHSNQAGRPVEEATWVSPVGAVEIPTAQGFPHVNGYASTPEYTHSIDRQ